MHFLLAASVALAGQLSLLPPSNEKFRCPVPHATCISTVKIVEVDGTRTNVTLERGVGLNDAAKPVGKLYFGTASDPCAFTDKNYMEILNNTKDFGQTLLGML